ncbi:MAG: hypothetical protein JSU91_04520, partial [Thermoplasmatales archaeon]
MNSKIVAILICIQIAIGSAITVAASMNIENPRLIIHNNLINIGSNTLIAETEANRVIEVDSGGTIVWQKTGLSWPQDAER